MLVFLASLHYVALLFVSLHELISVQNTDKIGPVSYYSAIVPTRLFVLLIIFVYKSLGETNAR